MAVKHTIRSGIDKGTITVSLTYRSAIRRFCIECMGFVKSDVASCTAPLCPLFPFRTGRMPGRELDPLQRAEAAARLAKFKNGTRVLGK